MPAMSDAPLRGHGGHDWFGEPNREHIIYPLDDLVEIYYNTVGHNTTLILGVTPNPKGLLPEPDSKRLTEFGREIRRRFGNPLAKTSGEGNNIDLNLPNTSTINQLSISEDIANGERVRNFSVEAKTPGGWKNIISGSCIGHKFIHRFDPVEASEVRLIISEAKGEPQIQNFTVYHVEKNH